jgi:hypothetical protein
MSAFNQKSRRPGSVLWILQLRKRWRCVKLVLARARLGSAGNAGSRGNRGHQFSSGAQVSERGLGRLERFINVGRRGRVQLREARDGAAAKWMQRNAGIVGKHGTASTSKSGLWHGLLGPRFWRAPISCYSIGVRSLRAETRNCATHWRSGGPLFLPTVFSNRQMNSSSNDITQWLMEEGVGQGCTIGCLKQPARVRVTKARNSQPVR